MKTASTTPPEEDVPAEETASEDEGVKYMTHLTAGTIPEERP